MPGLGVPDILWRDEAWTGVGGACCCCWWGGRWPERVRSGVALARSRGVGPASLLVGRWKVCWGGRVETLNTWEGSVLAKGVKGPPLPLALLAPPRPTRPDVPTCWWGGEIMVWGDCICIWAAVAKPPPMGWWCWIPFWADWETPKVRPTEVRTAGAPRTAAVDLTNLRSYRICNGVGEGRAFWKGSTMAGTGVGALAMPTLGAVLPRSLS